ncbi:histidine phosphatase superfamily [Calycina marina]|uniref:Histidine phosphatase superfamily n=1 Tax=Calycina marina TaxID=1763456 RepID=A0A9P7Z3V2_9HELO|nr:histidine phosphatase superfamily [Calycina marina]
MLKKQVPATSIRRRVYRYLHLLLLTSYLSASTLSLSTMYSTIPLAITICAIGVVAHSPSSYHFDPLKHLAGVAPPFDPLDPATDPAPPQGCNVTRVAILSRHAAIYSNDFDYETFIEPFINKLSNTTIDWTKVPILSFLATWKNPITDAEQEMLTRAGKLEATNLGVDVAQRYQSLRNPSEIWTSTADRTVKSAKSFAYGLADDAATIKIVEVSEGEEEGANSLTPYESCPEYSSSAGSDQSEEYRNVYATPAALRFNAAAPSFNFTPTDIYGMSLLCGYETVIRGSSPFCSLDVLSPNEWLGFEYTNDIQYFYNTGYGNPVSGAIGFPWVNATFDLLTKEQNTKSNDTEDQDLYVSFTHRELPPTVLVALGLFNNSAFSGANINETMPLDTINHHRAWVSSNILQFLTNIAIEKMECDSFGFDAGTYYRVLVNNSPQTLDGCRSGPGESCVESSLSTWLVERAEVVGDYGEMCQVDYSNSTNVLSIYQ